MFDLSGRRYIEGMAGLWCTALGYGNEELIEAACERRRDHRGITSMASHSLNTLSPDTIYFGRPLFC